MLKKKNNNKMTHTTLYIRLYRALAHDNQTLNISQRKMNISSKWVKDYRKEYGNLDKILVSYDF